MTRISRYLWQLLRGRSAPSAELMVRVAILFSFAELANAQSIVGIVRYPAGQPVGGAIIEARASNSREVLRVVAAQDGTFRITLVPDVVHRIRVLTIGRTPTDAGEFVLANGEVRRVELELAGEIVRLATFRVSSQRTCSVTSDGGEILGVLEEARKAILGVRLASATGRLDASWTVGTGTETVDGFPIADPVLRSYRAPTARPFASRSLDSLATDGFAIQNGDTWIYYAPDADVLASEWFIGSHCFRSVGRHPDLPGQLGIAFEPNDQLLRTRRAYLRGNIWIDGESAELRAVEFSYTGIPREVEAAGAGGAVEFLRLPQGLWIVSRWHIRMPSPTVVERTEFSRRIGGVSAGSVSRSVSYRSVDVVRGAVRWVAQGRDTLYTAPQDRVVALDTSRIASVCRSGEAPQPMLWGVLRDADGNGISGIRVVAEWRKDFRLYPDGGVSYESPTLETRSGAGGVWYLCDVPTGTRLSIQAHFRPLTRPVVVRVGQEEGPVEVQLGSRGRAQAVGTIVGLATRDDGSPWNGAEIEVMGSSAKASVDTTGRFRLDRVPVGRVRLQPRDAQLEDILGVALRSVDAEVSHADEEVSVLVRAPSRAEIADQVCEGSARKDGWALVGVIRPEHRSVRPPFTVRARWFELTLRGTDRRAQLRESVAVADASGRYAICGLPEPGTYTDTTDVAIRVHDGRVQAVVEGEQGATGEHDVVFDESGVVRYDFVVGRADRRVVVAGRVRREDGSPVAGALVSLLRDQQRLTRTDSSGRFVLRDVTASSHQLLIRLVGMEPALIGIAPVDGRFGAIEAVLVPIAQQLEARRIVEDGVESSAGRYAERKRTLAFGTFLDAEALKGQPRVTPDFLAARVPRSATQRGKLVLNVPSGLDALATCSPLWFVDGVNFGREGGSKRHPEPGPIAFAVDEVLQNAERIEVYRASLSPPEFLDSDGCGAVVVWTR